MVCAAVVPREFQVTIVSSTALYVTVHAVDCPKRQDAFASTVTSACLLTSVQALPELHLHDMVYV